ncbi:MAG: oligoribonuclease [Dehalococcoidia bacterium]
MAFVADAHDPPQPPPPLVWLDLEMSGLDPESCTILEAAVIVTGSDLEELDPGLHVVIHHPDAVLDGMDDWCTRQHGQSGLTDAVRRSTVNLPQAEERILAYLRRFTRPGESPLCGNSVGHDRRFLVRHMPALAEFLHYRVVDVSTIKELVRRWYPAFAIPQKGDRHRALDDIRDSIAELRYYRDHVFRLPVDGLPDGRLPPSGH